MLVKEHSAIISTSIKVTFSIKTLVLSFLKWQIKASFTVLFKWDWDKWAPEENRAKWAPEDNWAKWAPEDNSP